MKRIKVIYATKTGHSKKIALSIAKKLDVEAFNINENPSLKEIDTLFIVAGIYGGRNLINLSRFLEKSIEHGSIKEAALITSCASKMHRQKEVRKILEGKGIDILDEFICQGNFLLFGLGHPNKTDIDNANNFVLKYKD